MCLVAVAGIGRPGELSKDKGDVLESFDDGFVPSPNEMPPVIGWLSMPGEPKESIHPYTIAFYRDITFSVVGSNLTIDGFRIRIWASTRMTTRGKITLQQVESFITNWGGSIFSVGDNEVVFDILIRDALASKRFWDVDVNPIVFNELSYNQNSGIHQIEANYLSTGWNSGRVDSTILNRGGTIVSHDTTGKIVVFEMDRVDARAQFEDDIKTWTDELIAKRRYQVSDTDMNAVLSAPGGIFETTLTQFTNRIIDKASL